MSPMPAKWKTWRAPAKSGASGSSLRMSRDLDREGRFVAVVLEVVEAAAGEVVDDPDVVALREEEVDHVAADEPGAAGDDCDRAGSPRCRLSALTVLTLK